MKSNIEFKQFNLICENLETQLILEAKKKSLFSFFSKRWGLEDELEILLPFIKSKINSVFSNIYETGKPGEINLDAEPSIEPIDVGTDNPGFELKWQLDSSYVQDNLFPIIFEKPDGRFSKLNEQYKLSPDNVEFVIRINADNPKADLSKPEVQIKKLSIPNWNGDIYLNFEIPKIDRTKSNIKIGKITLNITVEEYTPLIAKLGDFMENLGDGRADDGGLFDAVGEGLANLFNRTVKKPKDNIDEIKRKGLENIPGAKIKCTVQFNDELKKDIELAGSDEKTWKIKNAKKYRQNLANKNDEKQKNAEWTPNFKYIDVVFDKDKILKYEENLNKFQRDILKFFETFDATIIDSDMMDGYSWTPAVRDGRFFKSIENKEVTNKTNIVACTFSSELNKNFNKFYTLYINIEDWKEHNFDNNYLIHRNSIPVFINIEIYADDETGSNPLVNRWYNLSNFKIAEPDAYKFINKSLKNIKPLM